MRREKRREKKKAKAGEEGQKGEKTDLVKLADLLEGENLHFLIETLDYVCTGLQDFKNGASNVDISNCKQALAQTFDAMMKEFDNKVEPCKN